MDSVDKLRNIKRADKIMVCNDVIVVVEKTARPKTDDVAKSESMVVLVKNGGLDDELGVPGGAARIYAVIHSKMLWFTLANESL